MERRESNANLDVDVSTVLKVFIQENFPVKLVFVYIVHS